MIEGGMEQGEARRRARELGGIAVEARWSEKKMTWMTGGWPHQKGSTWIVVSLDHMVVLADTAEAKQV